MIDKSKIAIVTTVISFDLYKKTAVLFPKEIDKIVIDGTNGVYGIQSIKLLFERKEFEKYEWIIMADEDVFFYDSNLIFDLIDKMQEKGFGVCGIRDGGVIQHRLDNPLALNPFFCILKFKGIREDFNYDEVLKFQKFLPELYKNEDYKDLLYEYNIFSLKEPYYCFYFWLKTKGVKFWYLDTLNPVDEDQTGIIFFNQNNEKIGFHSWYARAYNVYEDQTLRINNFISEFGLKECSIKESEFHIIRTPFFNWKKRCKKIIKNFLR